MHLTSHKYLKDGLFWFVELPDRDTKEENRKLIRLNKQVLFSDNEQKPALNDSDIEQIKKKKAIVEKQKTR